jgi:hypothetical protein
MGGVNFSSFRDEDRGLGSTSYILILYVDYLVLIEGRGVWRKMIIIRITKQVYLCMRLSSCEIICTVGMRVRFGGE